MDASKPITLSPVTLAALDTIRGSRPWLTQEETLTRLVWAISSMIYSNQVQPDHKGLSTVVEAISVVMDQAGDWVSSYESHED